MYAQTAELQERFISCLPCDESFNKVKAEVAKQSNTRMSATKMFANTIAKGVFNELNHFNVVDGSDIEHVRNPFIDTAVFEAPLRQKALPEAIQALNLHRIVGTGEASWYSPAADKKDKPLAEMIAARQLDEDDKLPLMKFVWLGQLALQNMFIRKVGSIDWKLVLGDLFETLIVVWPMQNHFGFWVPVTTAGTVAEHLVIVDVSEWEALMVYPMSPMHFAVKRQQGPCAARDTIVDLQASHCYDSELICAKMMSNEMPLLEASCRNGFGTLAVIVVCSLNLDRGCI